MFMKINCDMKKFHNYAFPMPAVLVTCCNKKGETNVITIAWHTTISKKPPLYGISVAPSRYSHGIIQESKEFIVNFVPYSLVDKVHFCGTHSGRKTDKIKEAGLTLIPSKKIKTPVIEECYAHLECKLYDSLTLGDHNWLVGEVVNVMADEKAFIDDVLDNKIIEPTFYVGTNNYTTIDKNKTSF